MRTEEQKARSRENARRYRERHPEAAKEATRRWREHNPEKVREANRKPRKQRPAKSKITLAERFWAKVVKKSDSECWLWTGSTFKKGYGRIGDNYRRIAAHRVSWELHFGPIPEGLNVCHECDNPPCCNPDHLFLGTQSNNLNDMYAKGRGAFGSRNSIAKLTEQQAVEIYDLYASGRFTMLGLAHRFGVSAAIVGGITQQKVWAKTLAGRAPIRRHLRYLTENKVSEIRNMYATKNFSQAEVARRFGISRSYVCEIVLMKKRRDPQQEVA